MTVPGVPQLFLLWKNSILQLILVKVVDDMLFSGLPSALRDFHNAIAHKFDISRYNDQEDIVFNRFFISRLSDGSIKVSMKEFMDTILPICVPYHRKKQNESFCSKEELREFQSLTGKLNFLGHGALPLASLVASKLQQCVSQLRIKHIRQLNSALRHLKGLSPSFVYTAPSQAVKSTSELTLVSFSDAATGNSSYDQTGFISGLVVNAKFYALDWHSSKQTRVSFSSAGAEILAAAYSADVLSTQQNPYPSSSTLPVYLRDLDCAYW